MNVYYRRITPGRRENLGAGLAALGAAAGVAAVTFYLVRAFLARETIPPLPPGSSDGGAAESPETSASAEES